MILIVSLFALSSCNNDLRRAKRYYRQAQDVAATDSDSALILIDSILNIMVFLDDDIRMNMSLMQAKALFTNPDGERRKLSPRIKATKIYTMPELEHSADYFAENEDYLKASYAALYSGYVQRESHDDDAAMLSFKNAAKYAEAAGDSLVYARAQYNVARLLYEKYLEDQAIEILLEAENKFGNHYAERALAFNLMAGSNIVLRRYDIAEECLKNSLYFADLGNSTIALRKANNNYSVLYRCIGDYAESIACLQQIETITDSTDLLKLYLNMALSYSYCAHIDSSAYYYDKVKLLLPLNTKKDLTVAAYIALAHVYEENDKEQAMYYYKKHDSLQYCIQQDLLNDKLYRIQLQYDYETLQNTLNRRIISNYRVEMTMAVALIIILVVALLLYYRIIQKNKKEAEIKATLLRVMKDNNALIQNKSDFMAEKLRSMQRFEIFTKDQKDKYLLGNLEKEMFGDKNHWEVMADLLNNIYPGLYNTLKDKYPNMSEIERRVYMLNYFKLSRIDEALLLDISTSVLDKARGKVKKLLEQDNLFDNIV